MRCVCCAVLLVACTDPANGTFVGNPTLQARYVDTPAQAAAGGRLVTTGTALEPCDAPTVAVGAQVFEFDRDRARVELDLPGVDLCGIRMSVTELAIAVDDAGTGKTVVGQDFDLWVPADAIPAGATQLELVLGDAGWLPGFVPLAGPGETQLNAEADPALVAAFFDGLNAGSAFEALDHD